MNATDTTKETNTMRNAEITNCEDIIDSRDIIARIEELKSERETLETALEEAREAVNNYTGVADTEDLEPLEVVAIAFEARDDAKEALKDWDESDEGQELKKLQALAEDAEGYCDDWKYGATLIRESYFTEYAKQLAEDIGDYNTRNVRWPYTCIDWEKAAEELKQDYTTVDFDGTTYFVR